MNDCLIVGGGAIGLALAYEMASCGQKVQVLERGPFGREASWAGAGILPSARRSPGGPPLAQLSALSRRLHAQWAQKLRAETGIDTGFRVCGELQVARTEAQAALLEQESQQWIEGDLAVERLSESDVLAREPQLGRGSEAILAAAWLPETAQIRNPRYVQALEQACRQRGVLLTPQGAVEDFVVQRGRVTEVITAAGRFVAKYVVLCAGAWTDALLKRLGHELPLKPIRGQIVLMKLPRPVFGCVVHEGPHYLVPRDDGYVLVGSTLEDVGFDKRTTAEALAELAAFAHSLVPALRGATIEQSWAGLRPGSALANPLIGPLPDYENVLVAAGHFRWGLYLSPATAVLLRQWLLGEKPVLSLDGFQAKQGE